MSIQNKLRCVCLILLLMNLKVNAQSNTVYSRYGLGSIHRTDFLPVESMGGISGAYNSLVQLNPNNPASYASLTRTSFEVSAYGEKQKIESSLKVLNQGSGNLSYLALGFPIMNNEKKRMKIGVSVGVLPFAKQNYSVLAEQSVDSFKRIYHSFTGNGAINQFYVGSGVKYKKLSVGFNATYVFGNSTITRETIYPDLLGSINQNYIETSTYKGFKIDFGVQYEYTYKEKLRFRAGTNVGFNTNLSKNVNANLFRILPSSGSIIDTPIVVSDKNYKVKQPLFINSGFIVSRDGKWLVGINLKTQSFEANNPYFKSSYTLSVGGEYIPNLEKSFRYFQTIRYRAGAFYGTEPLYIRDTRLKNIGANFGLGLPIKRDASILSVGFMVGQRGTTANNLLRETYYRASIGITFNDLWFIRPKYD